MTKKESQNGSTMGINHYTINEKVSKTRLGAHLMSTLIHDVSSSLKKSIVFFKYGLKLNLVKGERFDVYIEILYNIGEKAGK